jgi:hypothetical protein
MRSPRKDDDHMTEQHPDPQERILHMPSRQTDPQPDAGAGRSLDGLSHAEIAGLISSALEGAMVAFNERDPGECLQTRAMQGREAMCEMLASLPDGQATDPGLQTEYRRAIVFHDVSHGLAQDMVDAISRYARAAAAADQPVDA